MISIQIKINEFDASRVIKKGKIENLRFRRMASSID